MAELINTNKNRKKLILNGYCYLKATQHKEKMYWKCQHFKSFCKARLVTEIVTYDDPKEIEMKGEHNHSSDIAKVLATKVYNQIKEAAANTTSSPQELISKFYLTLPDTVKARLPTVLGMKETIRKIRNRNKDCPSLRNPANFQSIELPPEFQVTLNGELFVIFDSGTESSTNRMLIFGTKDSLPLLSHSEQWYLDGSFKTIPSQFKQLYILHCVVKQTPLPLLYALLSQKDQQSCFELLTTIKRLAPSIVPLSILIDFNKDMLDALKEAFPDTEVRGCFFHFKDLITSHILVHPNLTKDELPISLLQRKSKLLQALAFVPELSVSDYFANLIQSNCFSLSEDIDRLSVPLVKYFKKTFIGENSFEPPQFPISMWNFCDLFDDSQYAVDNTIESWHRCFNNKIGGNLWKFIRVIQLEEENVQNLIIKLELKTATTTAITTTSCTCRNKRPRKRNKLYGLTNELAKIVDSFDPDVSDHLARIRYLANVAELL